MKINIVLLSVLFVATNLLAQTNSVENEDTIKKKRLSLSFRFDYGVNNQPAFIKTRYFYEGEFYNQLLEDKWEWVKENRSIYDKGDKIAKQFNYKFDLLLSVTKQLNIGLSYKVLANRLVTNEWGANGPIDLFFSIAGTVDYEWQIPKVKNLYLNPTFSIGSFQDNYLDGRTGFNLYYDAKLALFYRLFDKLAIRAWASYDHFLYRNKKQSEVFPDMERVEKIDFRYINYGLGLSYRFFIYPD